MSLSGPPYHEWDSKLGEIPISSTDQKAKNHVNNLILGDPSAVKEPPIPKYPPLHTNCGEFK